MAKRTIDASEEEIIRLAAEAAPRISAVFASEGWELKDIPGAPTPEQVASTILELFGSANELMYVRGVGRMLPDVQRGHIRVEIMPDLDTAHVWLRVGDLHVSKK